jgi:hypothetical protein
MMNFGAACLLDRRSTREDCPISGPFVKPRAILAASLENGVHGCILAADDASELSRRAPPIGIRCEKNGYGSNAQRARTTPRANVDHVKKATIEKLRQL